MLLVSLPLSDLYGNAHRGKEPAVVVIAPHPTLVKVENVLDQTLHRFDRVAALSVNAPMSLGIQLPPHLLAWRGFVFAPPHRRQQLNIVLVFQRAIERIIIRLAIHAGDFDLAFKLGHFGLQPFGFVGTIGHPFERAQHRRRVGRDTKRAMPVNPAIRLRKTPGGFPIQSVQARRHQPLLFLLFVPNRPTRFDHHFVGADHPDLGQVIPLPGTLEERVEK